MTIIAVFMALSVPMIGQAAGEMHLQSTARHDVLLLEFLRKNSGFGTASITRLRFMPPPIPMTFPPRRQKTLRRRNSETSARIPYCIHASWDAGCRVWSWRTSIRSTEQMRCATPNGTLTSREFFFAGSAAACGQNKNQSQRRYYSRCASDDSHALVTALSCWNCWFRSWC